MKPGLYLETTIPSYLTSRPSRDLIVASHQQITRDWWETRKGGFQLFISQLVIDEAGGGDPAAARERLKAIQHLPLLDITPEVAELAATEDRSEEHTSELQSPDHLVCRLLLEKKKMPQRRISAIAQRRRAIPCAVEG